MIFTHKEYKIKTKYCWFPWKLDNKTYWLERIYYIAHPSYYGMTMIEWSSKEKYEAEREK